MGKKDDETRATIAAIRAAGVARVVARGDRVRETCARLYDLLHAVVGSDALTIASANVCLAREEFELAVAEYRRERELAGAVSEALGEVAPRVTK